MSCVRFIRENETTIGNQEPEHAQPMDDAMRHAVYQQLCFPYLYERFVKRMPNHTIDQDANALLTPSQSS